MADPSGTEGLLSRSAVAERAGVERPAVTNWQRRYPDYPKPVRVGTEELFSATEVHRWLSTRVIPRSSLRPGEVHGTTFGDRFAAFGQVDHDPTRAQQTIDVLLRGESLDRLRSVMPFSDYSALLQEVLYLRTDGKEWQENDFGHYMLASLIRERISRATGDRTHPSAVSPRYTDHAVFDMVRLIGQLSPEQDVPLAFDTLLDATAESQGRGSDVHTPPSVRKAMLSVLAQGPSPSSLYDPYCRSGELLVGAAGLLAPGSAVHGATPRLDSARTSELNLAVHAVPGSVEVDPELPLPTARRQYDMVLVNPPFGVKVDRYSGFAGPPWPFGAPSRVLDLAWVQYVVLSLTDGGRGAVVMPYGAAFRGGNEREIRAALVESGAIECVMALPANLFASTGIAVMVWFLRPPRRSTGAEGVLLIDASELGTRGPRRNVLDRPAVSTLTSAYRAWRSDGRSTDISRHLSLEELRTADYSLLPARYLVGDPQPLEPEASVDELHRRLDELGIRAEQADRRLSDALKGWNR